MVGSSSNASDTWARKYGMEVRKLHRNKQIFHIATAEGELECDHEALWFIINFLFIHFTEILFIILFQMEPDWPPFQHMCHPCVKSFKYFWFLFRCFKTPLNLVISLHEINAQRLVQYSKIEHLLIRFLWMMSYRTELNREHIRQSCHIQLHYFQVVFANQDVFQDVFTVNQFWTKQIQNKNTQEGKYSSITRDIVIFYHKLRANFIIETPRHSDKVLSKTFFVNLWIQNISSIP